MKLRSRAVWLIATLCALPVFGNGATEIFLRVGDIRGDYQLASGPGWIKVTNCSLDIGTVFTLEQATSGAFAPAPIPVPVTLQMPTPMILPQLALYASDGRTVKTVEIAFVDTAISMSAQVLSIKLSGCTVCRASLTGMTSTGTEVAFSYQKIEMKTQRYRQNGQLDGLPVTMGYDFEKRQKL